MRKVTCISEHENFANYAEPANVEIKPWSPANRTDWMNVGLFILGCCALYAFGYMAYLEYWQ